jgi:plastocyanin
MLRLLCIGGACLALALAGCGDDDEDTGGGGGGGEAAATQESPAPETTATETETETESEGASGGDTVDVRMKDFAFDPAEVEIKVGQSVRWTNEDDAPHNAVAEGTDLKTETFNKGQNDSHTFDEAGEVQYICTVHPQMKGTVTVTE